MRTAAIVVAAGTGERLGSSDPKAFVKLGSSSMLRMAVESAAEAVDDVVVAVGASWVDRAREDLAGVTGLALREGGPTRQASVRSALEAVASDADVIVCHDAARPFADPLLFRTVISGLVDADGVVPVLGVQDTVKVVLDGVVQSTLDRSNIALAQTPQAFTASSLRGSHAGAANSGVEVTDDAAALEWAGYRVRAIPGDPANFKITTPADLERARALVAS